jgi:maleate isomerase
MHQSDVFLPKIGALVPAGNITFEPDLWHAFIDRATVHSHRVTSQKKYQAECAEVMEEVNTTAVDGTDILRRVNPDVITYGFTTASFFKGVRAAKELCQRMADRSECPIVLPSLAILETLDFLAVNQLSVVTPYPTWNNEVLRSFLEGAGFEIVNFAGDERPDVHTSPLWNQSPRMAFERVLENASTDADVVLLPCTAWRTLEVPKNLQAQLKLPVITANQATCWSISRALQLTEQNPWI